MWHDETAIPLVLVHDETSHPHCSRFRILIEAQLLVFRMLLFSFVTLGYPIQSYIFFLFPDPYSVRFGVCRSEHHPVLFAYSFWNEDMNISAFLGLFYVGMMEEDEKEPFDSVVVVVVEHEARLDERRAMS